MENVSSSLSTVSGVYFLMDLFIPSGKPWLVDGLYKHLWEPHVPRACSGRGQCVEEAGGYRCQCNEGYTGELCDIER